MTNIAIEAMAIEFQWVFPFHGSWKRWRYPPAIEQIAIANGNLFSAFSHEQLPFSVAMWNRQRANIMNHCKFHGILMGPISYQLVPSTLSWMSLLYPKYWVLGYTMLYCFKTQHIAILHASSYCGGCKYLVNPRWSGSCSFPLPLCFGLPWTSTSFMFGHLELQISPNIEPWDQNPRMT